VGFEFSELHELTRRQIPAAQVPEYAQRVQRNRYKLPRADHGPFLWSPIDVVLISTYSIHMNSDLPISPRVVSAECFCLNLKRAARAVARRYDEALEPVALTNGQFSTLVGIQGLQPVSMQSLADVLGMDRTTLTATLKPLQRRGLVSIFVDRADRRGRNLNLTDAGTALLRTAVPLWKKIQQVISRDVGTTDAKALRAQLGRLA
jgi:DNA-binding MarR family transcriptional regulator